MRQPLTLDCRTWTVEKVTTMAELVKYDSVTYRAEETGKIVREMFLSEGDCTKLLKSYFATRSVIHPASDQVVGTQITTSQTVGRITTSRSFPKSLTTVNLQLDFRDDKCEPSFSRIKTQ